MSTHFHIDRELVAQNWKRVVAALIAIAAAAAIVRVQDIHAEIADVLAAAESVIVHHPGWGVLLFIVLSAASAMVAFFSSALLVPVGVYTWGIWATLIFLWSGWLMGGVISYCIGRYFGRTVVIWLVDREHVLNYEERISRHARFPIILLFQIAMPSELPGYILGILRYPFLLYLAALALAELPFAAGAVFLGRSFIRGDFRTLIVVGIAGVVFSVVAASSWHRRTTPPAQ